MLGPVPEQQQTRRGLALLAAERKAKARRLSAAAIVNKHVLARGGLEAWRGVQTLSLSGKMDAGTGDSVARSMRVGAGTKKRRREIAAAGPQEEPEKQVQLPFKIAGVLMNRVGGATIAVGVMAVALAAGCAPAAKLSAARCCLDRGGDSVAPNRREGFDNLLRRPSGSGRVRDVEVRDSSAMVRQDHDISVASICGGAGRAAAGALGSRV